MVLFLELLFCSTKFVAEHLHPRILETLLNVFLMCISRQRGWAWIFASVAGHVHVVHMLLHDKQGKPGRG